MIVLQVLAFLFGLDLLELKSLLKVISIANSYSKIEKIISIYSSPAGYKYIIFITIGVNGNMSTFESHELADLLEKDICKLEKVYNTFVHVEPI